MLQVIFNNDGSINTLIVGESIQQGNNNVNQIFASILERSTNEYTCVAEFELPNGDLVELSGAVSSEIVSDQTMTGYLISLSESVTLYPGNLKVNLKLIDLQDNVLCTYQVTLKVNPTGYEPNETNITEAQYNSLLQSLNSYALKSQLEESKVYDIVGTYSELASYDTQHLKDGDIIKVLSDSNYAGATTYYKWDNHNNEWTYIGKINDIYPIHSLFVTTDADFRPASEFGGSWVCKYIDGSNNPLPVNIPLSPKMPVVTAADHGGAGEDYTPLKWRNSNGGAVPGSSHLIGVNPDGWSYLSYDQLSGNTQIVPTNLWTDLTSTLKVYIWERVA